MKSRSILNLIAVLTVAFSVFAPAVIPQAYAIVIKDTASNQRTELVPPSDGLFENNRNSAYGTNCEEFTFYGQSWAICDLEYTMQGGGTGDCYAAWQLGGDGFVTNCYGGGFA